MFGKSKWKDHAREGIQNKQEVLGVTNCLLSFDTT
jgi:hypothetical protein